MIEYLQIQNFQKHERRRIELDPRLNVLIGETDAGKSSVLRALRWLALNQPQGDAFIREGTKGTTVAAGVEGRVVTRRRSAGGSKNEYQLDDEVFKAFGLDVPQPIVDLLRLDPVNFAGQLDAPFWLSQTPGEVSRQLNAIVDLGIIDETMSRASAAVRTATTRVSLVEERLDQAQTRLDELSLVPDAIRAYKCVQDEADKASELTEKRKGLVARLSQCNRLADRSRLADQAAGSGVAARTVGNRVRELWLRCDGLKNLIGKIARLSSRAMPPPDFKSVETSRQKARDAVSKTMDLQVVLTKTIMLAGRAVRPPDFSKVSQTHVRFIEARNAANNLARALAGFRTQQGLLSEARRKLEKTTNARADATRGQVCPVCERPL